jgi:hypothetical protein
VVYRNMFTDYKGLTQLYADLYILIGL